MASQKVGQQGNEASQAILAWKVQLLHKAAEVAESISKHNWWPTLRKSVTIVAAIGSLVWTIYQFNAQQGIDAHLQAAQASISAAQTLDQERQATFNTYLDRMSDMLLSDNLLKSSQNSPVRAIAEARTFTTLHDLDPDRKAELVHFLWKAELVTGNPPVISLSTAPLGSANFQHALLMNLNFSGALLINSTFNDCDLTGAYFSQTILPGTTLNNVNLSGVDMTGANLYGVTLQDATLTGVNMTDASLQKANLSGDDLTQVNLTGANLAGANLKDARITSTQFKQVSSLHDTIMPDGSTHL